MRGQKFQHWDQYDNYLKALCSSQLFEGYVHTENDFDRYLEWIKGEEEVWEAVYSYSDWLFSKLESPSGLHKKHQLALIGLSNVYSAAIFAGINWPLVLRQVMSHIIIYSYLRLSHSKNSAGWGEVEVKAYTGLCSWLLESFLTSVRIIGADIPRSSYESKEVRGLFVRLLNDSSCRQIFEKSSYSVYSDDHKSIITVPLARLNLKARRYFSAQKCQVFPVRQNAKLFKGDILYLDKHFALIEGAVRRNKSSTIHSGMASSGPVTPFLGTRLRVDGALLASNIRSMVKHRGLRPISNADDASSLIEESLLILKAKGGPSKLRAAASANYSWAKEAYNLFRLEEEASLCPGGFYLRFFCDFRGRVYGDSISGPTHSKYARYAIKFTDYSEEEVSSFKLSEGLAALYGACDPAIVGGCKTDFQRAVAVACILAIGKVFKSKLGGEASPEALIGLGCLHYADSSAASLDDELEINYYRYVMGQAVVNNNCGFPIYLDATASGLQFLGLLLEPKDSDVAEHLNFVSRTKWYDTYSWIISKFLSKTEVAERWLPFFTRKHLKKTIMVVNYNGSIDTCFESFVDSVGGVFSKEDRSALFKQYKQFYDYVKSVFFGDEFFLKNASKLMQVIGPSGEPLFRAWKNSKSELRLLSYKELTGSDFISRVPGACGPSTGCGTGLAELISDYRRLIAELPTMGESELLWQLGLRGGAEHYWKERKRKPGAVGGSTLCEAGLRRAEQFLRRKLADLEIEHETNSGVNLSSFYLRFEDGFSMSPLYMVSDVRRIDIKASKSDETEVSEFIDKHRHCYVKLKPVDLSKARSTEEIVVPVNSVDADKTWRALIANVVHACDSAVIRSIARRLAADGEPFYSIHDCLGVRPLRAIGVNEVISEEYSRLSFECSDNGRFEARTRVKGSFVML